MIEGTLYEIGLSRYKFHVIAINFSNAEEIAKEVIKNDPDLRGNHIYSINKVGYVYYPKTKTITVEI